MSTVLHPSHSYVIPNLGETGQWPALACACMLVQEHVLSGLAASAVGAVYLLAGVPETVELCLSVAGGQVDTHVLMTLAALGLLALGQASEVSPGNSTPPSIA